MKKDKSFIEWPRGSFNQIGDNNIMTTGLDKSSIKWAMLKKRLLDLKDDDPEVVAVAPKILEIMVAIEKTVDKKTSYETKKDKEKESFHEFLTAIITKYRKK